MEQLPNNCRQGNIAVFPKNWAISESERLTKKKWCITYWFYDDNLQERKQVKIRGMNHLTGLIERQNLTKALIEREIYNLKKGYNPITGRIIDPEPPKETASDVPGPKHKFLDALKLANKSINLDGFTKDDMDLILEHICTAAPMVQVDGISIDEIPIYEIKKRHLRALLNKMATDGKWSAHSWNKYRTHMMMLYKELSEYDAVESNLLREISKRKGIKKVRVTLTPDERKKVRELLMIENTRFFIFLNMFFHSGTRISEFFRIQVKDVDLIRQTVKVLVKKGKEYIEVIKPIKDIALPYWKQYLGGCTNKNYYLMGKGLFPAETSIRYDQINKRWRRWVKTKLGFTADFYSLKHSNSDEVSAELDLFHAQKLNSHTSATTTKIYAINEDARKMELIKKVANEF